RGGPDPGVARGGPPGHRDARDAGERDRLRDAEAVSLLRGALAREGAEDHLLLIGVQIGGQLRERGPARFEDLEAVRDRLRAPGSPAEDDLDARGVAERVDERELDARQLDARLFAELAANRGLRLLAAGDEAARELPFQ